MPLSAPFPPKSSRPATAASRRPSTDLGSPITDRCTPAQTCAPARRCWLFLQRINSHRQLVFRGNPRPPMVRRSEEQRDDLVSWLFFAVLRRKTTTAKCHGRQVRLASLRGHNDITKSNICQFNNKALVRAGPLPLTPTRSLGRPGRLGTPSASRPVRGHRSRYAD